MAFSGSKGNGFNLDCLTGNLTVTVITKCCLVFQGTLRNEEHARAQYGYPICFPPVKFDCEEDKDDDKKEDCCKEKKVECKKEVCPPKPIEVDVKCENEPKFICLELTCVPGHICCPTTLTAAALTPSFVTSIVGTGNPLTGGITGDIFVVGNTVLIDVNDIVAIGPSRGCLTTPATVV